MTKKELAMQNFREGYNCAQALVLAFEDELKENKETLAKLSSSFGGGMGRLREVCGAVSGMFIVDGLLEGYSSPTANVEKRDHYARLQALAAEFKVQNGSIVCKELLGGNPSESPVTDVRSDEYYKKRPCVELVGQAAEILAQHLGLE